MAALQPQNRSLPPPAKLPPVKRELLPDGKAGVKATLERMAALVRQGRQALPVRLMALQLVRELKQKDYAGEIAAVHAFVRDRVRYVRDVRKVETLHTAEHLLEHRQGDCDDKSILVASLLESIGHTTRLVAVGPAKNRFSHVLALVKDPARPGKWVQLETTEPWPVGKGPANPLALMIQDIDRVK